MTPRERVEALEKKAAEYGWQIYGPDEVHWLLRVARAAVALDGEAPSGPFMAGYDGPFGADFDHALMDLRAAVEDK